MGCKIFKTHDPTYLDEFFVRANEDMPRFESKKPIKICQQVSEFVIPFAVTNPYENTFSMQTREFWGTILGYWEIRIGTVSGFKTFFSECLLREAPNI